MGDSDDYKFLKITDAITSINQKVNLIGVIVEIGFPKQTKNTGISLSPPFFFFLNVLQIVKVVSRLS